MPAARSSSPEAHLQKLISRSPSPEDHHLRWKLISKKLFLRRKRHARSPPAPGSAGTPKGYAEHQRSDLWRSAEQEGRCMAVRPGINQGSIDQLWPLAAPHDR
ncbi:hypothetical protein NHX12_011246 [Muraenolepis orangiensis]|uniref:Uncharacterized protein n=1 Tax=Muraenolepis orangiensis TaxID=630683 RepID=A0A9Q0I6H4_9TELE|nr:hypothetical protein NHX12_011246 [Muraenolepis orangiensis]